MNSLLQLIGALGLVVIAIALSAWQQLGLEWNLAIAAGRTVLQLVMVGYLLAVVFAFRNPGAVLLMIGAMGAIATIVARNRISKKIPKLGFLVGGSIWLSTALTLIYTLLLIIQPETWYEPRFLIPLAGIVLGHAMNGAALAGERLVSRLNASQLEIETHLSLGASPEQAIAQYRKEAIRAALIPLLNTMMVIGLVTLPGIMTGQLLGGAPPLEAVGYQILIMFMLTFTELVTTSLVTWGIGQKFFNPAAQLTLW